MKLLNKYKNLESKQIAKNFFFLSVLQVLNIVLPFLTVPYLITTLGMENFGVLSFINTIIFIFSVLVEFGFNNSATKEISIQPELNKLSKIVSEVLTAKLFLLAFALGLLFLMVLVIPKFQNYYNLYLLNSITLVGMCLFPLWFFHGIQQMKFITYINVFFKTFFTLCIFIFVKQKTDIDLVILFNSLAYFMAGVVSLLVLRYKFSIKIYIASFHSVKERLKEAYHLFLSDFYMVGLSYTNVIVLGFFSSDYHLGLYSTADKVIRLFSNMFSPVINALYPHVTKTISINKEKGLQLAQRILKIGAGVILALLIPAFVFTEFFLQIVFPKEDLENISKIATIYRILTLFPLLSFIDQVYGKLMLIPTGNERNFSKVFFISSLINVILSVVLTFSFDYIGTAISAIIIQFLICFGMYYYTKKSI